MSKMGEAARRRIREGRLMLAGKIPAEAARAVGVARQTASTCRSDSTKEASTHCARWPRTAQRNWPGRRGRGRECFPAAIAIQSIGSGRPSYKQARTPAGSFIRIAGPDDRACVRAPVWSRATGRLSGAADDHRRVVSGERVSLIRVRIHTDRHTTPAGKNTPERSRRNFHCSGMEIAAK